jgi:hypothetical protein
MDLQVLHEHVAPLCDVPTMLAIHDACRELRELWRRRHKTMLMAWYDILKPCADMPELRVSLVVAADRLLRIHGLHSYHRYRNTVVGITACGEVHFGDTSEVREVHGYRDSCPLGASDVAVATIGGTFRLSDGKYIMPPANSIDRVCRRGAIDYIAACTLDREVSYWYVINYIMSDYRHLVASHWPDSMASAAGRVAVQADSFCIAVVNPDTESVGHYRMPSKILWVVGPVSSCFAILCVDQVVRLFCPRLRRVVHTQLFKAARWATVRPVVANGCIVANGVLATVRYK